jgi:hypothetical protein
MALLKRWATETFHAGGELFTCKVKCLSFEEAPEFLARMAEFVDVNQKDKAEGSLSSSVAGMYASVPAAFAKDIFERCVKDVQDLKDDEGNSLTTGAQLFELAPFGLVIDVLVAVQHHAMGLRVKEGKASPSPSGPATDPTPSAGVPDAASTVDAASPQP